MKFKHSFSLLLKTILFSVALFTSSVVNAQEVVVECDTIKYELLSDSVVSTSNHIVYTSDSIVKTPADYPDPTHRVRPAEWIVPGVAAVGGALCVKTAWGKQFREWTNQKISRRVERKVKIDSYLKYVPAVAVYGLDLCGVKAQHNLLDRTIILGMSAVTMMAVTKGAKMAFKEQRPDGTNDDAFPSGHTAISFMCAEFLWQEYRATKPWIGYTGYALATSVAYLRLHNNRHWLNDVVAGAAVGMLSTKFAYWLYPKLFKEHNRSQKKPIVMGAPFYDGNGAGVSMALVL